MFKQSQTVIFLTLLCFFISSLTPLYSYDDTTAYSNLLVRIRSLPLEKQLQSKLDYLKENPNSLYRKELEHNIATLEKLFPNKSNSDQDDKKTKDTKLFFKAQGLAKTLTLKQKIQLWQQFIEENPHSIYLNDAQYNLSKLVDRQKALRPRSIVDTNTFNPQETLVAKQLPYKDPKKAMTLATTAGLIVPGMGHWYTQDYVPAGIFTGLRVVGIGLFAKGYYDDSRSTQVTGFLIGLFSYVADIADAPFSVERYNDRLDKELKNQVTYLKSEQSNFDHSFVISFKF